MSEALVERLNAAEIALRDDRPYAAVAIGEAADRIEALDRENAESRRRNEEMDREITGLRNSYWEERKAHLAAEADKARLSEALRNSPDQRHFDILVEAMAEVKATTDGHSDQSIADIVQGCLDEIAALSPTAALSGSGSGWREITEDDRPPNDVEVLMGCWESWPRNQWVVEYGLYGSTKGGWIHGRMTHWLPSSYLPAAPQQGGK